MGVTKRLRYEILSRDGFACRYCGATDVPLHVDHVLPLALGGTHDSSNLATACVDCNSGKSSASPTAEQVAKVDDAQIAWRQAMMAALDQIKAEAEDLSTTLDRFYDEVWCDWTYRDEDDVERHLPIAREWRNSIRSMLARGMDLEILKHCVRIAMEASVADKWPYFCGVAWRTLDRAEAIAKGGE